MQETINTTVLDECQKYLWGKLQKLQFVQVLLDAESNEWGKFERVGSQEKFKLQNKDGWLEFSTIEFFNLWLAGSVAWAKQNQRGCWK